MGHPAVLPHEYNFPTKINQFEYRTKSPVEQENHDKQFTSLKQAVTREFDAIFNGAPIEAHRKGLEVIESIAYQYIRNAIFVEMGWSPTVGETITLLDFLRLHKIRYEYKLLVQTLLRRLELGGFLEAVAAAQPTWRVIQETPSKASVGETIKTLQTTILQFPECEQDAYFVNYIGPNLYPVLRGKESGLNILFPAENSPAYPYAAKRLYERSMTMKYYKLIPTIEGVTAQIQFLLNNGLNSATNPIKILEIGGGTGGTTIPLLRSLTQKQFPFQYTFTDISNFFVGKTKGIIGVEFPKCPIEYKMLDIEKRPEEQGIEVGSFDIVVAADVFHATEFLDDTLTHTQSLLKDGGLLVLGEVFQSTMFLEISFGLSGGWWRWGDETRLHGSALLLPSEWDKTLKQNGFEDSFSVGHPAYGVVFAHV